MTPPLAAADGDAARRLGTTARRGRDRPSCVRADGVRLIGVRGMVHLGLIAVGASALPGRGQRAGRVTQGEVGVR